MQSRAAAYGAAFDITRLQGALGTNLINAAYQPADSTARQTYRFLGRMPHQSAVSNPTVGQAAVTEMSVRMRESLAKAKRNRTLSSRSHVLDLLGIAVLLVAIGVGLAFYARRQRAEMDS